MNARKITSKRHRERRLVWAALRASLETSKHKYKRSGQKSRSNWSIFEKLLHIFQYLLKVLNLYHKGVYNAQQIQVNEITMTFDNLPEAFEGFKILHLTDLHIDSIPGHEDNIISAVADKHYDIALFTGDYRMDTSGSFRQIMAPMRKISDALQPEYGKWAVLGNHDTYLMAEYEEEVGINLLINESAIVVKDGQRIFISGTDDPYYYYSEQALITLEQPLDGFKIAMIHTSELRDFAADCGYNLYLSGHTHGGQICLPNGKALISHQFEGNEYTSGSWQHKNMKGYTSKGCGVSGLPIRFNCPPEIVLITLKKS